MPHVSLKLRAGVDQNGTPALNDAGVNSSQLIRFTPGPAGIGLPQPLGGWTQFITSSLESPIRALHPWADTNSANRLALGAEESLTILEGWTSLTSGASAHDATPQVVTDNVAVGVATTLGSNVVVITDTGSDITSYDTVFIRTHISVGGLILFGLYPCTLLGPDTFSITTLDAFGDPDLATSTAAGGAVAMYTTVDTTSVVTVTLMGHGYAVGDSYPALVSTTIDGIEITGNYTVRTVPTVDAFTIQCSAQANASSTEGVNGDLAQYTFYIGIGSLPAGSGYGIGTYGSGGYGTGTAPTGRTGTPITATDWTLDNWGSILLACPFNGPIYAWDPLLNPPIATIISEAPVVNAGVFVAMPERQIIAWGSTTNGIQDPLLIRWCDIQDYSVWTARSTNQAGQYRIPRGSKIVRGMQGPQQSLFWTDLAVWAAQYISQPFVYGFNELASGCGLIAPKAVGVLGGVVVWMSQSAFFTLSGQGVTPLPCPVWDVAFQDLDTANLDKIRVAPNSRFGEIAWYFPVLGGSGDVSRYVKYNVNLGAWDFGDLGRTAWTDQSVFGPPIGAGTDNFLLQHETSPLAGDQTLAASFSTGFFAMSEGDAKVFVDEIWPDMRWGDYDSPETAMVDMTFTVVDYPSQTPVIHGPYRLTVGSTYLTPRIRGRLMSITVESAPGNTAFWRLGNIRYRVMPDGKY